MTLQNRVDPWGRLHAHPSKAATRMGNRGILHDDAQAIVRAWKGRTWVCCDPRFGGIDRRPLFQRGRYSELFFLDEATAFAAGHRPCAYCQRRRFDEFKRAWAEAHAPGKPPNELLVTEIDAVLHSARAVRGGAKVTYAATINAVPAGALIDVEGQAYLHHAGVFRPWSFEGYGAPRHFAQGTTVSVLTPKPIVQLFDAGFKPGVHRSADA